MEKLSWYSIFENTGFTIALDLLSSKCPTREYVFERLPDLVKLFIQIPTITIEYVSLN